MLIEYAIIGGVAGAAAKAVDEAVQNKRKKTIQSSVSQIESVLNEIRDCLIGLGYIKTSCLQHELIEFLEMYNALCADKTKEVLWSKVCIDSLNLNTKEIEKNVRCAIEHGPRPAPILFASDLAVPFPLRKALLLKRASNKRIEEKKLAGCALLGASSFADTKSLDKYVKDNKTAQWLTYPIFRSLINTNNQEPVYNDLIEDIVLAATSFPHSHQTDSAYRKILKDEEGKKELGLKIEAACVPLEFVKNKITEVGKVIELETLRLREIDKRMSLVAGVRNNTEYANSICADIVLKGIVIFNDLLTLINTPILEQKGYFSEVLQRVLDDEEFEKRVVSDINFDKFDIYYQAFVDIYSVKEEDLSAYNIKIINSALFGEKTKYYYYYKNGEAISWTECQEGSQLCYEPIFVNPTEQSIEPLVKLLRDDMSMGLQETSLYFYGDINIYNCLNECVVNRYKNVKTKYKGDGKNEK